MNQKLPKVFPAFIKDDLKNIQDIYYSNSNKDKISSRSSLDNLSIESKINRIFKSPNYIYKKEVIITKDDNSEYRKTIIGRTNNSLLTLENETIDINKIKDIKSL